MKMIKVDSSNIESIGHQSILRIQFKGRGLYEYNGVPKEVYDGLMKSTSKGKYFHKNIKGVYDFIKITPQKSIIEIKEVKENEFGSEQA